eukprot:4641398-Prymnesium_polylepis.1
MVDSVECAVGGRGRCNSTTRGLHSRRPRDPRLSLPRVRHRKEIRHARTTCGASNASLAAATVHEHAARARKTSTASAAKQTVAHGGARREWYAFDAGGGSARSLPL